MLSTFFSRRTALLALTGTLTRKLTASVVAHAAEETQTIHKPPALLLVVEGHMFRCGDLTVRCAIGRGGLRRDKREGDGATPVGSFPLRRVMYRADRLKEVETGLPVQALRPTDGWCDDADDPRYNELITLPYGGHHEELWREDHVYDVIVVIGYNDGPIVRAKGSAIFLHLARLGFTPTDGCVAVERAALLEIVRRCDRETLIEIKPA